MFDFPNAPTVGQMVTGGTNGAIYRWDGVKWALAGPPPSTVQSFNGRTGAVTLAGGDVSLAQGYTSYNAANPSAYIADAANDGVAYVRRNLAWLNGDTRYMQQVTADAQYVRLDGTVPMTGVLTLSGSPTLAQHAATRAYVDAKPSGSFVATTAGSVPLTGVTTETNLAALRIPGGTIGANGAVEVKALWSYTNNANTKSIITRFGPTAGQTTGGITGGTVPVTTTASAQTMLILHNNNAANAQAFFAAAGTTPFGNVAGAIATLAVDTTADTFMNINATLAVGTDTITLVHAYLVVFPHA